MLRRTKARVALIGAVLIAQGGCATGPVQVAGDWRPLIEACPDMRPLLPLPSLPGTARLKLSAELRDERVVAMSLHVVKGIEDRRAQRMALQAVDMAVKSGRCPGVRKLGAEVLIGPQQAGFQQVQLER